MRGRVVWLARRAPSSAAAAAPSHAGAAAAVVSSCSVRRLQRRALAMMPPGHGPSTSSSEPGSAAAVRERRQTKEMVRRAVEAKDVPLAVYGWLELSVGHCTERRGPPAGCCPPCACIASPAFTALSESDRGRAAAVLIEARAAALARPVTRLSAARSALGLF
jgi:hypothetical protein